MKKTTKKQKEKRLQQLRSAAAKADAMLKVYKFKPVQVTQLWLDCSEHHVKYAIHCRNMGLALAGMGQKSKFAKETRKQGDFEFRLHTIFAGLAAKEALKALETEK